VSGDLAAIPASQNQPAHVSPAGPAESSAAAAPGSAAAGEAGLHPAAALYANPVSQLDPALGIVVLHFYNAEGTQTASIPTQKQLDSYRLHGDADPAARPAPHQHRPQDRAPDDTSPVAPTPEPP
jgi:hypothetical protein